MFQTPGTTESHPVQIRLESTGVLATGELTNVTVYYEINNGSEVEWTPAPTIVAYSNNMFTHKVTIPSTVGSTTFVDGDKIRVSISCDQGSGQVFINFRTPLAQILSSIWEYATRTITAVPTGGALTTDITSLNNLSSADVQIAAGDALTAFDLESPLAKSIELSGLVVDLSTVTGGGTATLASLEEDIAGISITGGSGGMGHIISTYEFDPANNTIEITEVGYTDVKQEQILSIFNTTTGQWYYNSELRRYGAEPGKPWTKYYPLTSVEAGVITYTASDASATAGDILQIIVNKA